MDKPNIERLPKWAQDYIRKLERERDSARNALAIFKGEAEQGCSGIVILDDFSGFDTRLVLPDRTAVKFMLGKEYIEVMLRNGTLNACASRMVNIIPSATNSFNIKIGDKVNG